MISLKSKLATALFVSLFFFVLNNLSAQQPNDRIWVTEIQVAKPAAGSANFYNPEVHLFEAGTDNFLGCSGNLDLSGCTSMAYDFHYSVQSAFAINDSTDLLYGMIAHRTVYLQVIANSDTAECPQRANIPPDQLLAVSPPFSGSAVAVTNVMQFGQAMHLRLGTSLTRTPQASAPLVKVKEVAVVNESDGLFRTRLEIEVHLYDSKDGVFLGCSGQINGLRHVDYSGRLYFVDASFRRPLHGPDLTYDDVKNREIYIEVIEDDSRPCSCNTGGIDDFIAITSSFPGAELLSKEINDLGNLKRLLINVDGVPSGVTLTTPTDFSQVTEANPAFSWQPAGVNITQYQLQIAADSLMNNIVFDETTAQTTLTVPGNLLQQGFHWWQVRAKNMFRWGLYSRRNVFFYLGTPTAITDRTELPTAFALAQNYPNPFNPSTTIDYQLPMSNFVALKIYNLQGQLVRTLVEAQKPAGSHEIVWDGRSDAGVRLPSGIYLYRIEAGDFRAVRRLALVK